MIRLVICLFLVSTSFFGEAQQTTDKKTLKLISKADELLKERSFGKAKSILIDALERDPVYEKAYQKLFIVLRVLAEDKSLISWQQAYISHVPEELIDAGVWQNLASYHHSKGEYQEALGLISNVDQPDSILIHSIEFALQSVAEPDKIEVSELPGELNQLQFQYLPVLTLDGRTMIFTGIKTEGEDEDIYQSTFDDEKWQLASPISNLINTPYNEGACTISADGRTLIFTACEGRRTMGSCDLFIANREGDQWVDIKNMGRNVNSRFWDSQPSLSADGRTLYFVSNRPGGIGGKDIWKSALMDGKWSPPENLGRPVNTRRDETTPFIFSNARTLFFSSNGHVGLGGFDLYKVEDLDSAVIQNLGSPVNTHNDEVSLFVSSNGLKGFFAKEKAQNGRVLSSRLHAYVRESDRITRGVNYLTGTIRDHQTGQALSARIELVNLKTREVEYQTSSDVSDGLYFLVLPLGKEYGVFVEKEGYLPEELSIITGQISSSDTLDFSLKPIAIGAKVVLKNIYFDFDSDQIKSESFEELDRIIKVMSENPQIGVRISGHTDDLGATKYNMTLSTNRAKAVHDHLVHNGVDPERIEYQGLGSSKPIAENTSEDNRRKNRRIEFEIVSADR